MLYALALSPTLVLAAQMLHGVTYGLMFIAAVVCVNHRLAPTLRASGQGALGVMMSIAQTAAPFVGGIVAAWAGFRGMYAVMAAIALAGLLVSSRLGDHSPTAQQP